MARVVVVVIVLAVAPGGGAAVDQVGVGGGKLLHTPALRAVRTCAGLSPKSGPKFQNCYQKYLYSLFIPGKGN